ncbi:MAG: hypothetical protein MUE60_13315 [Candidatus Eisenbacteria bacterium]|nr:hypothetical protein [Candidatus Eisenbacteria bacterium]
MDRYEARKRLVPPWLRSWLSRTLREVARDEARKVAREEAFIVSRDIARVESSWIIGDMARDAGTAAFWPEWSALRLGQSIIWRSPAVGCESEDGR